MRTSDIKRLGEAYASVVESSKVKEDKKQFVYAAKMAKDKGEKTFTFAGKKYDVEEALNGNMVECADEKDFKPHMMYDPKTGKGVMAKKYADHISLGKKGYVHDKPKGMEEGFSEEEVRELCHSKDHNCAIIVNHPEWGLGKPVYESHAIPTDDGYVEWYDVEFKHGIEKEVPGEDMEIIEEANHMKSNKDKEDKKMIKGQAKKEDNTNDKSDDGDGLDKVQPKAVKKKFKDRKDKDIDNDGDVDSSDEYLHKRRKAVSKAVSSEEDENGEEENGEKDKKKKMPFPPKKNGNGDEEEKGNGDDGEEKSDDSDDKENGKDKDKKKKVAQSPKTAEISKIGEATEELLDMLETVAKQQKSNAEPPEPMDSKDSEKSKEFKKKHDSSSDKGIEDNQKDAVDKTTKAGSSATKPNSGKRPQDNKAGDTKVVNPVKESFGSGSTPLQDKIREVIMGKTMKELQDEVEPKGKAKKESNPYDGRTKNAKAFLERMAKLRGK